jgi:hypothetical protein
VIGRLGRDLHHLRTHRTAVPQVRQGDPDVRTFCPASRITDAVLSFPFKKSHDGVVRTTLPSAAPTPGGRAGASTRNAAADLERFWPSRRGHAFDEFCR